MAKETKSISGKSTSTTPKSTKKVDTSKPASTKVITPRMNPKVY